MESKPIKKYSAIDMFKCAPEFRESSSSSGVKVDGASLLPQEFFVKCGKLFPTAECDEEQELKRNLNDFMYEKAQKKHKNYLRRQRAKQAKNAQKEREVVLDLENQESQQPKQLTEQDNKFDTFSLAGSDSGVSVKSGNSTKIQKKTNQKNNQNQKITHQKTIRNIPKIKTIQKFTVFKGQGTPETSGTPEFSVRQPTFATGLRSNFQNQGKLRASTDDKSVIGDSSPSTFVAKPVSEPRTWSNSRLHKRQPRGRIGSRS